MICTEYHELPGRGVFAYNADAAGIVTNRAVRSSNLNFLL